MSMELAAGRLYADKTQVIAGRSLNAKAQKSLLEKACGHFAEFGLAGVECALARTSGPQLFKWAGNKALIIEAEIAEEVYQCIITLNTFGGNCVVGCYRQFLDDELFTVTHSAEARRRAVIDRLRNVESIDFFLVVDHAVDEVLRQLVDDVGSDSEPG